MTCPCSGKRYEIRPIKINEMPNREQDAVIQAYDAEPCHEVNGAKERMVLLTWRGLDEARHLKAWGKVELMSEEKFQALKLTWH